MEAITRWGWITSLVLVFVVGIAAVPVFVPGVVVPFGLQVPAALASVQEPEAVQPAMARLVEVRAAHHAATSTARAYDRIVFEFDGPVPPNKIEYVTQLVQDGSGYVLRRNKTILKVTMHNTVAHNDFGQPITRRKIFVPPPFVNIQEILNAGDYEAIVTYGIVLHHKAELRVDTTLPKLLVIDFVEQ